MRKLMALAPLLIAGILAALGIHQMILLTNTHHSPVALSGYGLEIVEREIFLQMPRHRALGAGHGRGRCSQAGGFVEHGGRSMFWFLLAA